MLITNKYRKLNEILHRAPRGFGASGHRWHAEIALMVDIFRVQSWLDYGCGQSTLKKEFKKHYAKRFKKIRYREYDPAVKSKCVVPRGTFDLVTCTDVLEHVEPSCIDEVIKHIYSKAGKAIFFNINIKEANKTLPDGRNAHLIIENPEWWLGKLKDLTDWKIEEKISARPWKDLNLWSHP